MHRLGRILKAHRIEADQRDSAQQRHARSVELQERQLAENHPQVNDKKDDDNGCCHV